MNALECKELFHRYFHCIEFCTLEGWLAHQRCIFHHWPSGTRYWDTVKHNEIQYVLTSFLWSVQGHVFSDLFKWRLAVLVRPKSTCRWKMCGQWLPNSSVLGGHQSLKRISIKIDPEPGPGNEIRCELLLEKWICPGGLRWSTNSAQGGLVWQVHKYDEEELLMWFADIWNTYEHPDFILRMVLKLTTLGCSFAALGLWQWDNLHDEPMIEWSIHINPTFQDGSSAEKSS